MAEMAMAWVVGRSGDWLGFLAGAALKGGLLLAIAAVATLVLRRASAATRHQLWLVAVVCALVVPALGLVLPRLAVPVPGLDFLSNASGMWHEDGAVEHMMGGVAPAVAVSVAHAVASVPHVSITVPVPAMVPVAPREALRSGVAGPPPPPHPAPPRAISIAVPGEHVAMVAPVVAVSLTPARYEFSMNESAGFALDGVFGVFGDFPWALLALAVWAFGTWVVLAALVLGVLRVHWLSWRLPPFGGRCAALVHGVADELGLRGIDVLRGPATAMPMTWGILRATIVLPSSAAEWPIERLDAVVRHELAHIRRRDTLTQLIADIACAVYWFNPLAWLAAYRLRIEREHACDDEVLASGSRASDYAEQLLLLTRSLRRARATSLTAIAMARPAQLEGRLTALLDEDRSRSRLSRGAVARGWLAAAALVLPLAMIGLAPVHPLAAEAPFAGHQPIPPMPPIPSMPSLPAMPPIPPMPPMPAMPPMPSTAIAAHVVDGWFVAPDVDTPWLSPPIAVAAPARGVHAVVAPRQGCRDVSGGQSLSIHHDDDVREITWKSGPCRGEVRIEGEV
ncbi:MAG: M56 family metallopeptidase, partial [Longimicrobiales bacterium]